MVLYLDFPYSLEAHVERPTAVTAIGMLGIAMAAWTLLSLFLPSSRAFLKASFASDHGTIVGITVLVGALAIAVLLTVAGVGVLSLKSWSRVLAQVISAVYLLMSLAAMFSGPGADGRSDTPVFLFYFGNLITIAVCGLIIWYLYGPPACLAFDKSKESLPVPK